MVNWSLGIKWWAFWLGVHYWLPNSCLVTQYLKWRLIMESTKIILFKGKKVRKTIFENERWFSVVDVIAVLTDSANSRDYRYKMKIRAKDEAVKISVVI